MATVGTNVVPSFVEFLFKLSSPGAPDLDLMCDMADSARLEGVVDV